MTKPGDEFTTAWVKRGEELRARQLRGETLTPSAAAMLAAAQDRARALQQRPEAEVAADYLAAQKQRDCDEALKTLETLAAKVGREVLRALMERVLQG